VSVDLSQLPDGCPPLSSYYVYLTEGCNLACKHCWQSPKFSKRPAMDEYLDYSIFVQAVEEGMPLGLNCVKLTGGEPLLHPDFTRMVDFLAKKGLGLTIETNGTLLTRSLANYLRKKSTLNFISVSLDGADPGTHDRFRGVDGSFDMAYQGLGYLVEVGYRPQVIMSLHEGNIGEIESLIRLVEKAGAGSVKFNVIQPIGRGCLMSAQGQAIDIGRLIEIGNWVECELQKRTSIPLKAGWPKAFFSLRRLLSDGSGGCSIFNILGILSTGNLALCGIGKQVPELCYGLVGEDRVVDVWTGNSIITELRSKLPENLEGICSRCILQGSCLGFCIAANYFTSGRLTAPFWFCDLAEKKGLFPVSRLRAPGKKTTERS
jgi:SynChlorMet cassette radical SAM/SPASM protein ScmF